MLGCISTDLDDALPLDGHSQAACRSADEDVRAPHARLFVPRDKHGNHHNDCDKQQYADQAHANYDKLAVPLGQSFVLASNQSLLQLNLSVHLQAQSVILFFPANERITFFGGTHE